MSTLYAATDNGYIIKDATTIVFNFGVPTWLSSRIESLLSVRGRGFGVVYNGNSGGSPAYPLHLNNGVWTQQAPDIHTFRNQPTDATGASNLYNYSDISGTDKIYKSTDRGLTWALFVDAGVPDVLRVVLADATYVWYTRFDTPTLLYRIKHDGTGATSFALGIDADNNRGGNIGHDRIYLYRTTQSTTVQLESIDVSSGVPVVTHVPTPFVAPIRLYWIQPLTNTIAIALVVNDTNRTQGAIYRTIDAGVTWTNIVGMTVNLRTASITQPTESAIGSGNNNVVSNRQEVWAGSAYPYLYHSLDSGLTFSLVTSSVNLNDPGNDSHNWTSLLLPGRIQLPFAQVVGAH